MHTYGKLNLFFINNIYLVFSFPEMQKRTIQITALWLYLGIKLHDDFITTNNGAQRRIYGWCNIQDGARCDNR